MKGLKRVTVGEPDEFAKAAIVGTIGIGSGFLKGFHVNDVLVLKEFKFKYYCIVDYHYGGLVADNKLVLRLNSSDKWYIEEQNVKGPVLNSIDDEKYKKLKGEN